MQKCLGNVNLVLLSITVKTVYFFVIILHRGLSTPAIFWLAQKPVLRQINGVLDFRLSLKVNLSIV